MVARLSVKIYLAVAQIKITILTNITAPARMAFKAMPPLQPEKRLVKKFCPFSFSFILDRAKRFLKVSSEK
jgi:hypothetical protein